MLRSTRQPLSVGTLLALAVVAATASVLAVPVPSPGTATLAGAPAKPPTALPEPAAEQAQAARNVAAVGQEFVAVLSAVGGATSRVALPRR